MSSRMEECFDLDREDVLDEVWLEELRVCDRVFNRSIIARFLLSVEPVVLELLREETDPTGDTDRVEGAEDTMGAFTAIASCEISSWSDVREGNSGTNVSPSTLEWAK